MHFHLSEEQDTCREPSLDEPRKQWKKRVMQAMGKEFAWAAEASRRGSRARLAILMGSPGPLKELGVRWTGSGAMANRRSHLPLREQRALVEAYAETMRR